MNINKQCQIWFESFSEEVTDELMSSLGFNPGDFVSYAKFQAACAAMDIVARLANPIDDALGFIEIVTERTHALSVENAKLMAAHLFSKYKKYMSADDIGPVKADEAYATGYAAAMSDAIEVYEAKLAQAVSAQAILALRECKDTLHALNGKAELLQQAVGVEPIPGAYVTNDVVFAAWNAKINVAAVTYAQVERLYRDAYVAGLSKALQMVERNAWCDTYQEAVEMLIDQVKARGA